MLELLCVLVGSKSRVILFSRCRVASLVLCGVKISLSLCVDSENEFVWGEIVERDGRREEGEKGEYDKEGIEGEAG